jgi:hypothetical protein
MDTRDFPTTILPLLENLLLDIKKGQIQADGFKHMFQFSFVQWIVRHVGEEPKQADWSREPARCKKKAAHAHYSAQDAGPCEDCQQLNRSLQHPRETVWRFCAVDPRRTHLTRVIRADHECSTTIERTTPYTLVVTKHKQSMEEKHRKWIERVTEVQSHLGALEGRHHFLDKVLAEKYSDIMFVRVNKLLARVRQAAGRAHVQTSGSMIENAESHKSPRGEKRKAGLVDLTDN